jgi:hypothetical protein
MTSDLAIKSQINTDEIEGKNKNRLAADEFFSIPP